LRVFLICVYETLTEVGLPVIIEGNFVYGDMKKVDEAGVIKALADKYAYETLTFKFSGDTRILYERYIERNKSPERGDANRDFTEPSYDDIANYCRKLSGFNIGGKIIKIDTTDFAKVNFDAHIKKARLFYNSN